MIDLEQEYKAILDDIQQDLIDAQSDPNDLNEDVLRTFYDRICDSVTSYENLCSRHKPKKEKLDFTGLHFKLQSRMNELIGSKNFKVQGKWNFIPSEKDLINKLQTVCVKYKLKDVQKIQNLLLLHCERAVKESFNYVPLLIYYISKSNVSQLASDMESTEEIKLGEENKIQPNINTKDLF